MLSHPTILPPPNQLESTILLDQAASLLLSTLGLCDGQVAQTLADPSLAKRKRGRPLQLPWVQLWGSLLLCTLGGMRSFADFRRFIGTKSLPGFAPVWLSRNALVKRLLKAGLAPLEDLWVVINERLRLDVPTIKQPVLASFASCILCLDETKLDRLARFLKPLRDMPNSTPALFGLAKK